MLIPSKIPNDKILNKVEKWYRKVAEEVLVERVSFMAKRLKLRPGNITTNNNKTRWGVCDSHGNIAINYGGRDEIVRAVKSISDAMFGTNNKLLPLLL